MSTEVVLRTLDVDSDTVSALAAHLSPDERERADRFRVARDRRRFVVGRGYLRELIGERVGYRAGSIRFQYGSHGKPWLPAIHFNVTHRDDVALYAFCDADVGIDVEAVERLDNAAAMADRFFSLSEKARFAVLDERVKPLAFFNGWTRKEAFVKAHGDGLSMPLDAFDVTLAPDEPARILRVGDQSGDECGWMLHSFSPLPGYIAAIVSKVQ